MSLEPSACEGKYFNYPEIYFSCHKWNISFIHFKTLFKILDLKAFERRLTEVIACLNPSTLRWRSKFIYEKFAIELNLNETIFSVVLTIMSISTSIGAWYWLTDPRTSVVPLTESLLNHPVFTCATLLLSKFIVDVKFHMEIQLSWKLVWESGLWDINKII